MLGYLLGGPLSPSHVPWVFLGDECFWLTEWTSCVNILSFSLSCAYSLHALSSPLLSLPPLESPLTFGLSKTNGGVVVLFVFPVKFGHFLSNNNVYPRRSVFVLLLNQNVKNCNPDPVRE